MLHRASELDTFFLERPGQRKVDEVEWEMDWIHLAQDEDKWRTVVNTVMNLRVP